MGESDHFDPFTIDFKVKLLKFAIEATPLPEPLRILGSVLDCFVNIVLRIIYIGAISH